MLKSSGNEFKHEYFSKDKVYSKTIFIETLRYLRAFKLYFKNILDTSYRTKWKPQEFPAIFELFNAIFELCVTPSHFPENQEKLLFVLEFNIKLENWKDSEKRNGLL